MKKEGERERPGDETPWWLPPWWVRFTADLEKWRSGMWKIPEKWANILDVSLIILGIGLVAATFLGVNNVFPALGAARWWRLLDVAGALGVSLAIGCAFRLFRRLKKP